MTIDEFLSDLHAIQRDADLTRLCMHGLHGICRKVQHDLFDLCGVGQHQGNILAAQHLQRKARGQSGTQQS